MGSDKKADGFFKCSLGITMAVPFERWAQFRPVNLIIWTQCEHPEKKSQMDLMIT